MSKVGSIFNHTKKDTGQNIHCAPSSTGASNVVVKTELGGTVVSFSWKAANAQRNLTIFCVTCAFNCG